MKKNSDRIGGGKGPHSGHVAGSLSRKLEEITRPPKVRKKVKKVKLMAGIGLKRAALHPEDAGEAPGLRPGKKARPEQKSGPMKKVGFAPDEHLVSFAPPPRLSQALAQPSALEQEALQLLSDACARTEAIGKLPLKSARARALSALISNVSGRVLAVAGRCHGLDWAGTSRRLALIALFRGVLTKAALRGEADVVKDELGLIADHMADPGMLREYWQVETLEIVVTNVLASTYLLSERKFDVAAERAYVALDSLCEGMGSSVAVGNALEALIDQWAMLGGDLNRLSAEFRPLIAEVAHQIAKLSQRD
ncbi:hypothetical protein [Rhizobacter sp. SG703]|uniref:hypothetical protein n=1 Tax=Rhizobacter sp. SG703 TaxID=2587140 RepID=UPI0014464473|nr:hypothetical protein [Rhizobacter sp. SG703]NKI92819.1 hypothetical protein [Rhizobacter sp. SG703]